jgi:hypothetical protein
VEELLGRGTCVCILRGWRFSESVSFLLMYVVGGVGVFLCLFTYTVSVACFMRCFGFGFCITFLSFRTIIIPVLFLYSVIISSFHVSTRYPPSLTPLKDVPFSSTHSIIRHASRNNLEARGSRPKQHILILILIRHYSVVNKQTHLHNLYTFRFVIS